jgi:flagellar biosynthesis repressor protein FlbT
MSKTTTIPLQAGQKIFINGAVVRADRAMTLELLNDVPYLLEHQIMQVRETTTTLRQLYYVLQTMIMDPSSAASARDVFECSSKWLVDAVVNKELLTGVIIAREQVAQGRTFDALKMIRDLIPIEDGILSAGQNNEIRYLEAV